MPICSREHFSRFDPKVPHFSVYYPRVRQTRGRCVKPHERTAPVPPAGRYSWRRPPATAGHGRESGSNKTCASGPTRISWAACRANCGARTGTGDRYIPKGRGTKRYTKRGVLLPPPPAEGVLNEREHLRLWGRERCNPKARVIIPTY